MTRVVAGTRRVGRRTAIACLACTLVTGAVVALEAALSTSAGPASPAAWWASFAVLVAVQLVATELLPRPRATPRAAWLVALVVAALTTFLLHPEHALTAAVIVGSAAAVAQYADRRTVIVVIAVQTLVATAGIAGAGWPVGDILAGLVVYTGFQAFGVLVVRSARSEAEARLELDRTHAELRATVALLEAATRDAERLRIARDLHDVVGHQLTALAIELEVASHKVASTAIDAGGAQHVERARALAKSLLQDVRTAVGAIRDGRTELGPMLRELADGTPGLRVGVHVDDVDLGPEQTRVIVRCVQEAITNTLRHAGASRLDVRVEVGPDLVRLLATDDGHGVAEVEPGHGLTGMRERLLAEGGDLTFRSAPGEGFTLDGSLRRRGVRAGARA